MKNCPQCEKACEWKNEAFICDDCKIVFFFEDNIKRLTIYLNSSFKRIDDVKKTIKSINHEYLYGLDFEHLNGKEKMTSEREYVYDAFRNNQALREDVQLLRNKKGVRYPDSIEDLHKLYDFERSIQKIEQIAIDLQQKYEA